jgi:hypothetical protein
MAHIDSRVAAGYYPDPCKYPISRYRMGADMSVALDKLFAREGKGVVPPHADRFYVDFNPDNKPKRDRGKGSLLALDENGNFRGGIRNTYVDVPVKSFHVPKDYYNKVARRFDELVKEGWALPVYREMVLSEARGVSF